MIVVTTFALLTAIAAPLPVGAEEKARAPVKEKKICRRDEVVGTRLAPRICLTKDQWNARDAEQRERTRQMRDQADRPTPGA